MRRSGQERDAFHAWRGRQVLGAFGSVQKACALRTRRMAPPLVDGLGDAGGHAAHARPALADASDRRLRSGNRTYAGLDQCSAGGSE